VVSLKDVFRVRKLPTEGIRDSLKSVRRKNGKNAKGKDLDHLKLTLPRKPLEISNTLGPPNYLSLKASRGWGSKEKV